MFSKEDGLSFLGLPIEIFEQIIQDLVEVAGVESAAKYRRLNKAFAFEIHEKSLEYVARKPFSEILDDGALRRFFLVQSSALLMRKVLSAGNRPENIIICIKSLGETVAAQTRLKGPTAIQYISGICNSFGALKASELIKQIKAFPCFSTVQGSTFRALFPAIQSAVQDTTPNLQRIDKKSLCIFKSGSQWFPNALTAAVASNNIFVLRKYLEFAAENHESTCVNDKDTDCTDLVAEAIGNALGAAIRLHKNEAGSIIFEFFKQNLRLRLATPSYLSDSLLKDAARQGNTALFYQVYDFRRWTTPELVNTPRQRPIRVPENDLAFVLKHGSKSILTMLIRDEKIDSTRRIWGDTPLQFVLENRRRDLADIMLRHGTSPYEHVKEYGCSMLWYSIVVYNYKDARVMLAYGGDPEKACPDIVKYQETLNRFKKSIIFRLSQTKQCQELLKNTDLSYKDLRDLEKAGKLP